MTCLRGSFASLAAGTMTFAVLISVSAPGPVRAQGSTPDTTPENLVAFFPLISCPTGWSVLDDARGRFLMAVSSTDNVGKTVGTPLVEGFQPAAHTHSFQSSVSLSSHGCYDCFNGGAGWTGASKGSHTVPSSAPGTTGSHQAFSYTQLLACQKDASPSQTQSDTYAQNMVALYNTTACPSGWEQMQSGTSAVNGAFAVPFASPGTAIGTVTGTPLTPGATWSHDHAFSSSISVGATDLQADSGSGSSNAHSGTYDFSGTTGKTTIEFPYLQLLMCKKTAYTGNTLPAGVPQKILMFYAENDCPDGWVVSPSGFNRPLLGLPENGTPNESVGAFEVAGAGKAYAHDHSFKGSVDVGSQKISVDSGCSKIFGQKILCDSDHGNKGSVSFSGTTSTHGGLPYISLSLCQPDT